MKARWQVKLWNLISWEFVEKEQVASLAVSGIFFAFQFQEDTYSFGAQERKFICNFWQQIFQISNTLGSD